MRIFEFDRLDSVIRLLNETALSSFVFLSASDNEKYQPVFNNRGKISSYYLFAFSSLKTSQIRQIR